MNETIENLRDHILFLERIESDLVRQRDEARIRVKNHHLAVCETCMACTAERDAALVEIERLRRLIEMVGAGMAHREAVLKECQNG